MSARRKGNPCVSCGISCRGSPKSDEEQLCQGCMHLRVNGKTRESEFDCCRCGVRCRIKDSLCYQCKTWTQKKERFDAGESNKTCPCDMCGKRCNGSRKVEGHKCTQCAYRIMHPYNIMGRPFKIVPEIASPTSVLEEFVKAAADKITNDSVTERNEIVPLEEEKRTIMSIVEYYEAERERLKQRPIPEVKEEIDIDTMAGLTPKMKEIVSEIRGKEPMIIRVRPEKPVMIIRRVRS